MSFYRAIGTFHSKKTALTTPPPVVPPPGGYADIVTGLAGGGPIAYWRRNSNGTLIDASGNGRDMTVVPGAGSVTNVLPGLPANSDEAMYFTGGAGATDAHEAAYDLADFSVSFWLRPITLPGEEGLANPYFAKETVALTEGDFVVYAPQGSDGLLRARIRNATGVAQDADALGGTLQVGVAKHICVRANNTGMQLWVGAQLAASAAGYAGAWTNNTGPITLATAEGFGGVADAHIDEVAVFSRYITDANIATLAQGSVGGTTPVTVGDAFAVNESTVTIFDIVANDEMFIGAKEDLTLTIVDDSAVTAAGHTVTVENNDIRFTANAVGADQVVSFTYTITDANGTSNVSTVQVTVVDTAAPPAIPNANCYPATGLDTIPVASGGALTTAINNAVPGDHITLAAANYGTINISCQGTQANPIVIRPQGADLVPSSSGTFTFTNASRWTVVKGVNFNGGGGVVLSGDHNRVDKCRFQNAAGRTNYLRYLQARDCRVSRCEFGGGASPTTNVIVAQENNFTNGTNVRNRFDHCYVHDIHPTTTGGAQELWKMARIDANIDMGNVVVCTIDRSLFTNWSAPDENELFTLKAGGHIITHCTFDGCDGYVNNRQAIKNRFISCWFEDFGPSNGSAGLNLKGNEHIVAGCRFVRSHCEVAPGNFSFDDETPTQFQAREGVPPHPAAVRCQIIHCVFDNCQLRIGPNDVYPGGNALAEDNNHFGCTNPAGTPISQGAGNLSLGPKQNGTTNINPNLGAFDAAVKLTTADVGLNADDPYC